MANRIIVKDGNGYTESFPARIKALSGAAASASLRPGNVVKLLLSGSDEGKFQVAAGTADADQRLFVLAERDYIGETINTAYTDGDTAHGYELIPNRTATIRSAVDNYVKGSPITLGTNGLIKLADTANEPVIGHADEKINIGTAGNFVKVRLTLRSTYSA